MESSTLEVDEIKRKILPILRRHGVRRAGIFGSVVRGRPGETATSTSWWRLEAT